MLPASRTPDGTPIDCPVCGLSDVVTPSTPPGDCVCPHCGSLVWVPESASSVKVAVRAFTNELQELVKREEALDYTVGFLVGGLRKCLAAYGAALWINPKRKLLRRAQPRLLRNDGQAASSEFAREVIARAVPMARPESTIANDYLHLGVPILHDSKVLGVLEVDGRLVSDERTQRGYIRFIDELANISRPLAVRLQNA